MTSMRGLVRPDMISDIVDFGRPVRIDTCRIVNSFLYMISPSSIFIHIFYFQPAGQATGNIWYNRFGVYIFVVFSQNTQEGKEKSNEKGTNRNNEGKEEGREAEMDHQSYGETMHMSKQGIYDQLVSEYGGQFPAEAAQYALDNVEMDWNANALAQAESYSETMHMSKQGIYDQLISEQGGQFTAEEAQYAVDNLQADYKANALEQAKSYQESMNMSHEAIRDQLVSEYGGNFTQEEADYAVANLEELLRRRNKKAR